MIFAVFFLALKLFLKYIQQRWLIGEDAVPVLTQHSSTQLLILIFLTPSPPAVPAICKLVQHKGCMKPFWALSTVLKQSLQFTCKEGHGQAKAVCHRSQGQSTALLGQLGCQQGVPRLSRSPGCPSGRTTEEATWPRGKPPVPLAVSTT